MHPPEKTWYLGALHRLPCVSAVTSACVGILVLIGWQANIVELRSILPALVAMNPLTALGFIAAGVSLGLLRCRPDTLGVRWAGRALAAVVLAMGATKLSEVVFHTGLSLDQLLFHAKLDAVRGLPPNRMAPNTAACFVLVGAALLCLRWEVRRHLISQYVALSLAGASLLAILGYALDVLVLYGVGSFIPMALNTAVTFWLLSMAILFAYPDRGITRVLVARDAGGTMARRVLPFALLMPVLLAWIRSQAQRAGILAADPGVSVMVFVSIVLLTAFIWFTAQRLSRADAERKQALEELQSAHGVLELRVHERTAELEDTNERLRDSEARYRLLFDGNPHPMWVYDRATLGFLAVNAAAVREYGYPAEEFLRMTLEDICPEEDLPAFLNAFTHDPVGLSEPRNWGHRRKDGSEISVETVEHPLDFAGRKAMLVLSHDVSEKERLELQLRQSQKMEAIGLLAGGIAHDFNNLLTAIMGYSHLMRYRLSDDAEALSDTEEILKASERAASLTRQLLAFSRQQVLEPRVLDLNAIVTDLDPMLRRLIGEDIDLLTAPAADLGSVKADPGQVEQVLMNLVVNARDAMPDGGKLTIETANVDLGEGHLKTRVDLKPGRYIMVAVTDTGCGMSPEIAARIFDPFFTTKEKGRGTGLGLSTVHGIVKQSEGHIDVYSEPGQGTSFKVYLPRVEGVAEAPRTHGSVVERCNGNESLLVVEDEEIIRRVLCESLEMHGYVVIPVADGNEAIAVCQRHDQRIDLLVTDVVMPLMSGPELAHRVAAVRPELPVLFVSGYTDRALVHQGVRRAGTAFLQKPFTPDVLARKVREVLDRPMLEAA